MTIIERARQLRPIIEQAAKSLSDAVASESAELFPKMKYTGELIKAGTRINWGGTIMKAAVDLWDREENNPNYAPTLWEEIEYIHGIRKIPEDDIFSVTKAFAQNELGWWDEKVYKSLVDGNVYHPRIVPTNWEEHPEVVG